MRYDVRWRLADAPRRRDAAHATSAARDRASGLDGLLDRLVNTKT